MNHRSERPSGNQKHAGRQYLFLGILSVLVGPVIYAIQMLNHSLVAAWYLPALATLGTLLIAWSFVKFRTVVRGVCAVFSILFAGLAWLMVLGMPTPPYEGPVTVGDVFPTFKTRLISGAPFQQGDLKGKMDTVMVFFRGEW